MQVCVFFVETRSIENSSETSAKRTKSWPFNQQIVEAASPREINVNVQNDLITPAIMSIKMRFEGLGGLAGSSRQLVFCFFFLIYV